jgi:hypothetical protein
MKALVPCALLCLVLCSCASRLTEGEAAFKGVYAAHKGKIVLKGKQPYRVQIGDSPTGIARAAYGEQNGFYFPLIMLASWRTVLEPAAIEPGMKLTVPDLQRNLTNGDARAALKALLLDTAALYAHQGDPASQAGMENLAHAL